MGLRSLVILLISHSSYLILFFLLFKNKTSLCCSSWHRRVYNFIQCSFFLLKTSPFQNLLFFFLFFLMFCYLATENIQKKKT